MTVATAKKLEKEVKELKREVAVLKAAVLAKDLGGKRAITLNVKDFDDILEELDPEFQKSLKAAYREYVKGRMVTLQQYLKRR